MRQLRPRARGIGASRGKQRISESPGLGDPRGSRAERRPAELLWAVVAPPAPCPANLRRPGRARAVPESPGGPVRGWDGGVRAPVLPGPPSVPTGSPAPPADPLPGNPDVTGPRFAAGREGSARHSVALCGSAGVRGHGGGGSGSGGGRERQRERGGGERGRKNATGSPGGPHRCFRGFGRSPGRGGRSGGRRGLAGDVGPGRAVPWGHREHVDTGAGAAAAPCRVGSVTDCAVWQEDGERRHRQLLEAISALSGRKR